VSRGERERERQKRERKERMRGKVGLVGKKENV
jgi:hypothetical protein